MLYPFTFKPILKKVIWGGSDICPFKGITPVENGVGESWELSHVEGNYSIVDNGELEGKSLDELIRSYGKELLGEKVMERFGTTFPLLIKFIDARDNLSIQVHPDDELAKKRQKIKSTITNARLFLAIQKEFGCFYNYTLSFFPDRKPIINTFRSLSEIPVTSPESEAMSKDMKKRGFKFFGPTICYAHLQASGFINDHLIDCVCRKG